ncbi:hypothetical protein [Sporisorium scitamineum]|uniref:DUF4211 domain-containing protein n=1 Tax=Sporisorium scitamineum TaxID=49012 RepID=A0A0F7S392_9BASI|nr:hypothetical protein [Sporisorium scitamineum]
MFLGTSDAAPSNQVESQEEDNAPLFVENASDEEDMLRNEAPLRSQASQRPRIKSSPTYGDRIAQGSSKDHVRSSTPRPAKRARRRGRNAAKASARALTKKDLPRNANDWEMVEYDEGFQPEDEVVASPTKPKPSQSQLASHLGRRRFERDADGRIRLIPISADAPAGTSSNSILAAHGLGGASSRKGLDELCLDWIEWAAARVLVTWSSLSQADRERLEGNRAALKSRIHSIEESVGTVTMRRQFKWYLTRYPKIEVESLFSDEVDQYGTLAKNGCGICHRKSKKAQFKVTFLGERYNQETLAPLKKRGDDEDEDEESDSDSSDSSDDDSDSASDRSSDNETWREEGEDARDRATYTFFAGNHCAQRAAILHKLHHWEWMTMQTLARHDSIRYIRRLLWRKHRMGRGKDGKMGAGAWEVWLAVNEMISD